jgi:ketosteroid isomerase-like protein
MAYSGSSLLATLMAVSLLGAAVVSNAAANDARATVDKLNQAFMAAFERGDVDGVMRLYSSNATLFPPGTPPIVGATAIGGFWKKIMASGVKRIVPKTTELDVHGDTMIELGEFDVVREAAPVQRGRFCVIWKRENGNWKVHRDLWNVEPAAPAQPAASPTT